MKRRALILLTAFVQIVLFAASICLAEEGKPLDSPKAKASYSLGYLFGKNLKTWAPDLDTDILFAAVRDGLEGKKPVMTQEEIQKTMKRLSRDGRSGVDASKNKAEGEKFLAAN